MRDKMMRDRTQTIKRRLAIMGLICTMALSSGQAVHATKKAELELVGYQGITTFVKGQEVELFGQVITTSKITKVVAYILGENGETVVKKVLNMEEEIFYLSDLRPLMEFESLEAGNYVLKVCGRDAQGIAKTLVKQAFTVEEPSITVEQWLEDCKEALQYYPEHKFAYGVAAPSYIATETTNQRTNCAAYVSWCLYRNGFVENVSDTNQIAQGAASYVYGLGWEMNTDVNDIQAGDVVYYRQGTVTKAFQKSAIKWFEKNGPGSAGSGMHVDICYDPENKKFLSAGSSTYIKTGKIATYGDSYLKAHFVCSFRFPQNS